MNKQKANAIYDILVEECGAPETARQVRSFNERDHFVQRQCAEQVREWRFCGLLGFGGKFWRQGGGTFTKEHMYVTCYKEDETPFIKDRIAAANKRLGEL